jgi:hypothetical protein
MQEYNVPKWSFSYIDMDGAQTTKHFESVSWVTALQEFMYFLRGAGFSISDNAVQVHSDVDSESWQGEWCYDTPECSDSIQDWGHPDDTDTSMHFCPPFKGDPDECAFKHKEKYEIRDLIEAVECLTQEVEEANHYKKLELKGGAL